MNRSTKLRLAAAAGTTAIVAVSAGSALADSTVTQPVTLATSSGTRTLNLYNLAGGALNGIPIGTGHTGGFVANVTDKGYQHVGYQVTAELSNLYPYKSGKYDFNGSPVPSSAVKLGFPAKNPLDLTGIASDVTPVISLTGDLSSVTSSLLSTLGLGSLGAGNITTTLATTVDGAATPIKSLVKEITDGVASDLPITLNTGTGGAFTNAGPMTGVSGAPAGSGNPTQLLLEKGKGNSITGLLNDLLSQLGATASGVVPVQTLINDNILSQSDVLSAIQSATGIPLDFLQSNLSSILGQVSATITGLANVVGQDGSYSALPLLSVSVPKGTPAGSYQGILTVNLMDVPNS